MANDHNLMDARRGWDGAVPPAAELARLGEEGLGAVRSLLGWIAY